MTAIAVPDHRPTDTMRTTVACAHCALPVPPGLLQDNSEEQFCCSGCHTAFALLHEHGLDSYYGFAERRETPVRASGRSYDEYDHAAFTALYVRTQPNGVSRTELYLEGLHCASCVWLVERVPLLVPGVQRAELDVRRSLAVVEWDASAVPLSAIARSLDSLGYAPHPFRGVARADMRRREDRAMLVRIGVAGAIAINVMLAALALYAGELNSMDTAYTRFFRWVSLVITIPAFVWPGRVFFVGAWAALRTRALHMDLPIALALAAGFVRGTLNTITHAGPIYFDGLVLVIFALLVGRFLQQRGQRMAIDATEQFHAMAPRLARVVDHIDVAAGGREVPSEALMPGMLLEVRAGESFPADGIVMHGHSAENAAWLTGESRPTTIDVGDTVFAGTLNTASPVYLRVTQAGESSRMATLLQQVEDSAARRSPIVQLANRLAGVFTAVVLLTAIATFVVKLRIAPAQALDDAIALLIVTCPCVLALATPLAVTVAVSRAARRGLLIKGGDALEWLSTPGTMVLDKTGTITEGRTALMSWHGPDWVKPLVLALEHGSSHPLAEGFRVAWPGMPYDRPTSSHHVVGGGLEGIVNGYRLCIGAPRFVARHAEPMSAAMMHEATQMDRTLTPVHIAVNGEVVAVCGLGDRIRDDAQSALDQLRARGWRTVMLSGDTQDVVNAVGSTLGFSSEDVHGAASPEEKLAFITRLTHGRDIGSHGPVVMVGDGVNDAAAIAAAHVGIGVHGGAEASLATADIYLTRPGLGVLVELVEGSRRTMQIIRRNMALSVAYNVVGASLAMMGILTPLIAAILMPTSSVSVILATWYSRQWRDPAPSREQSASSRASNRLPVEQLA